MLILSYTLSGPDLAQLHMPANMPPGPAHGLWQHTCFEAFVAAPNGAAYHEYNFSPSGQWARYRFSAERVRDGVAELAAPAYSLPVDCSPDEQRMCLQVELPLADLPDLPDPSSSFDPVVGWWLGLSAVLEHADGRLSYWALHHPRAQPDFHHPAGRVLRLLPPAS